MILTCPACDTKYVVKDDAIPPGGRNVRCASCKHSWHQDPDGAVVQASSVAVDFGAPPPPSPEMAEAPLAEAPAQALEEGLVAEEPQPEVSEPAEQGRNVTASEDDEYPQASEVPPEAPVIADGWRLPEAEAPVDPLAEAVEERPVEQAPAEAEEEFVGYAPIDEYDEEPPRRWPLILGILALIVAAAAAFWFLAPPEWKARAGIAQAGTTPLQLMITTSDRQPLKSGNDLLTISGRVINPTDQEHDVPPIQAELRDKQTRAVIHRWTIAPPARVLAPRSSASFYSAGVNVPEGGDELTVTLGQAAS